MTQTWRERAGAQFAELEMMQSAMQQQRRGADRGGGGGRREQSPLPRVPFEGAVPLEEQSRQVDGWAAQQQQRRTPQRRTAASTGNRPTRAAQIVQSVTGYSAMTVQAVRDEQEELRRRKEILARDVAARRTKQQEQQKQTNEALRNHAETIRKIRTNSAATSHRDDIRRSIRQWKTNQEEERRQAHVANIHINAVAGIEDNNGDSDSAVLGEGEVGAAAAAASPLRVVPSSPGVSIFVKGRQDHGLDVLRVPQQQQQYRMAAANRQGEPDRPQQHNHRTAQEDDDNEEDYSIEGEEEGEVDDEATAVAAEEDDNTVRLTRPSTHADPSRVFLDDTTPQPERHPPSRLATAAPVSLDADGVPPSSSSATLSSSAVALVGPHNSHQRKLWYEDDEDSSLSPPRNRPPTAVANAHPPPPPLAVDVHRPRNEPLRAAPAQQEQQQQAAPSPLMSFEQDDAPHPRKQLSGHHQYSSTAATAHRGLSQQHSPSSSSPVAAAADWAVDAIRTAMRSTLTAQEVEEIFIVIATLVRRPAAERLFPDTNAQFTAQVRRILLRVALRQQQPLDRVDASIDAVMPLVWQLVGIQGIQQMALEMQRRDGI